MRRRLTAVHKPSPATIIASVALFFSLTGAGLAASHYLITSTSQIKPSVRHALRGHRGPAGRTGATGAAGQAGIVDWDKTYKVFGAVVRMSATGVVYATAATCSTVKDRMITGGFLGDGDAVSGSEMYPRGQRQFPTPLLQPTPDTWGIVAQLAPGATQGFVQAWALCATG